MSEVGPDLLDTLTALVAKKRAEHDEESAYHWAEILRCLEQIEALRRRERGEDGFDG